jgi:hypothetical protein
MKIKNVNFIEKHVEKIVLGVGLACALGVLSLYALSDPYYVKVGQGDPLYPADVEMKLQNQAKELERNLNSQSSGLPPITIPPYTATFEFLAHQTPPSPRPNLIYWWASPGLDPMVFWVEGGEAINRVTYDIPAVPLPTDVVAKANFAKLGRTSEAQRAQLEALTHATGPGDFFYVTVSGNFDMGKWRDAIMAGKEEKKRIKEEWFRNAYLITFVYAVRSEWDEDKQEWGPQTRIEPLPGNPDYSNPQGPFTEADGQTLLREIRLNRKPIAEPPFLPVDAKRPWSLSTDIDPSVRIRQLNTELTELQKRHETITKDANTGKDRRLNAREQQEVKELNAKMSTIREELAKLQAAALALTGPNRAEEGGGINMVQKVWAHDVNVQPGKRYRYRLYVGIQNPLFQRNTALQPQQKMQQNNRVSQMTEYPASGNEGWVEVTVPKNNHFFVIGAQKATNPQESTVEAEVWKVFNAGWHKQVFTVQPGDAIGQVVETTVDDKPYSLDLKTGRTLVDVYFTGQAATGQQVGHAIMVDGKEQLLQIPTDSQVQDPVRQQLLMDQADGSPRPQDPAPETTTKPPATLNPPPPARGSVGSGGSPPPPKPGTGGAGPSGPMPPGPAGPGNMPGAKPAQPAGPGQPR